MTYLIQENGVVTLLGRNVLSFQTVGNFFCVTLQTKEEELMLKHCSHWYECLLSGPHLSNTIFYVGKIVI